MYKIHAYRTDKYDSYRSASVANRAYFNDSVSKYEMEESQGIEKSIKGVLGDGPTSIVVTVDGHLQDFTHI